jgi:Tfp pilus assembly protein PilX
MLQAISLKKNESGYIIIVALLILALLTVISVSAINMSTTESKIATNELLFEKAFYAAESGLQQVTEDLRSQYLTGNSAILATSGTPNWSFALAGAVGSDFAGGVEVLNRTLDNVDIQVRIWNNNDGGGPVNDTDGLIYARSVAEGPRGAVCRVEMLLEGDMSDLAISDYSAQEGAGPGKNFVSSDADKIVDFSATGLALETN